MIRLFTNNAVATLASPVTSSDMTLTLAAGKGALFPTPTGGDYFVVTLTQASTESSWEDVSISSRSGDVLTVAACGYGGSTAASWSVNDKVEIRMTADAAQAGANALSKDTNGNVTANVLHRTGTLSSLLTLAGGDGELSCATDAAAIVKHTGVAGQAKAFYAGGGLVLYNSTATTASTIDCDGFGELYMNAADPTTLDVILPQNPSDGQEFKFRQGSALAAPCTISFWTTPGKTVSVDVIKFANSSSAYLMFEYISSVGWAVVNAVGALKMSQLSNDSITNTGTHTGGALTTDTVLSIGSYTITPPYTATTLGSQNYLMISSITFTLGAGAVLSVGGVCNSSNNTDYLTGNSNKPHVSVQGPPLNTTEVIECILMCKLQSIPPGGTTRYLQAKASFSGGSVSAAGYSYAVRLS